MTLYMPTQNKTVTKGKASVKKVSPPECYILNYATWWTHFPSISILYKGFSNGKCSLNFQ